MKKVLVFSVLILLVCTSVFADSTVITALFTPYSAQHISNNVDSIERNSKFGIGGKLSIEKTYANNFYFGGEAGIVSYTYDQGSNNTDVTLLGFVGYGVPTARLEFFGSAKLGVVVQSTNGASSTVFAFGPELGLAYAINEKVGITAILDDIISIGSAAGPSTGKIITNDLSVALGVYYAY